jgi:alkanesulfonate monooxygenase SsuD/methylene tetrahydromethanopterin reductase-like flavin-dependent oxidoreductase (luciferase family)
MPAISQLRIGVTLPTFRGDARTALGAARDAESAGLHGVFCFDHLWPMGQPGRPALSCLPMLAAVAAVTRRIRLGPLVARVGLLPDQVLLASLESLANIAGDRLLVGIGTGDSKSAEEHLRNGLAYLGPAARLESLVGICRRLHAVGIEAWVGAGSEATNEAARAANAALNFWDVTPERLSEEVRRGPVTWGGPIPGGTDEAAAKLLALAGAGASWVVWGWPSSLGEVAEAARAAGVELGPPGDYSTNE